MTARQTWRVLANRRRAGGHPGVFNIPSGVAFVDALAQGILDDTAGDPLALAAITVLLPTRRACRALRDAFLRLSQGAPLLLPRLMPLNDMDDEDVLFSSYAAADTALDIPPPIAPLKRQLMLATLVRRLEPDPEQSVRLAAELAKFLDQVQIERLSFDNLQNLVPEEYAAHWQQTLQFMQIITRAWPDILAEDGALDPADHRNRIFAAQAAIWAMGGASGPVIAAGSTGSIPATADLLTTIAQMPDGCVVLPGLDMQVSEDDWEAIDDPHPQQGIKHLLARMGAARDQVLVWPGSESTSKRDAFLCEVMRPAATTQAWQTMPPIAADAVAGLSRLDCESPREEAEAAALLMRETLEHPEKTCALVTPDRDLAQRVAAELERWNIDVDDSAGKPLTQTPPGTFLRLTAAMVAEDFAPVALLAVCKHPLAAAGFDAAAFRALTRLMEREALRGPRPPPGLDGLARVAANAEHADDIKTWLAHFRSCCTAFADLMQKTEVPLSQLVDAHMEAAEALAATPDLPGPLRLWAEEAGETAALFIAELAQCADTIPAIAPRYYPGFLQALMETRVVRPRFGRHPRLHILGPLEARLQRFDVLILSGLNEGTWPAPAAPNPWMSRPMRTAFGLPLPERRIGQAAHDIVQAMSAPRVILTRSKKVRGTPTVPSRWLMRLDRVVELAGLQIAFAQNSGDWQPWTKALSAPRSFANITPPAPRPPVIARPRRLSVTDIEKWMRDPYGIYARHILKLQALDPLEQDVSAADYGTLIHKALQDFIAAYPSGPLPPGSFDILCNVGRKSFDTQAARPGVIAFWWPRFQRMAAWFIATEDTRRNDTAKSFVEIKGQMTLRTAGGDFELVAKADRIDHGKDGGISIIDYKTGTPPRESEVIAGFAPQLPLEAAMMNAGGFSGVPLGPVKELSFWHLHGRPGGGDEKPVKADAADLAKDARDGLMRLISKFDDQTTAYEARPSPEHAPKYSDYEHLARVKEWSAGEDEGTA